MLVQRSLQNVSLCKNVSLKMSHFVKKVLFKISLKCLIKCLISLDKNASLKMSHFVKMSLKYLTKCLKNVLLCKHVSPKMSLEMSHSKCPRQKSLKMSQTNSAKNVSKCLAILS